MQDWGPDQHKTFELLFFQIGGLEQDLLSLEGLS